MSQSRHPQQGFTLIEVMVVIVIIGIVASLVVMNISGVDQRKAMQAREILMLDLKRMNREAIEQSRIYALQTTKATDVAAFNYYFAQYQMLSVAAEMNGMPAGFAQGTQAVAPQNNPTARWQAQDHLPRRALPDGVSFTVDAVQLPDQIKQHSLATTADLMGSAAPALIWLGNGQAKPVRIQMYYAEKPVGDAIEVDSLGKVNDTAH